MQSLANSFHYGLIREVHVAFSLISADQRHHCVFSHGSLSLSHIYSLGDWTAHFQEHKTPPKNTMAKKTGKTEDRSHCRGIHI